MKRSGQVHYKTQLEIVLNGGQKNLKNCIGKLKLRDVTTDRVQMLVSEAIRSGYTVQSAKHIANCVSAIFTFAEEIRWHQQANPARFVRLPEMVRKQTYALTLEQFIDLRAKLPSPAAEMFTIATLTGIRIGELLALRWGRINFGGEPVIQGGVMMQPLSISVVEQFHRKEFTTLKGLKKRRTIPLNPMALDALRTLREKSKSSNPDDLVFPAPRKPLQPLDAKNIFNRILKPIGIANGVPWLNWHSLRHTFSTWTDGAGISPEQRRLLLGHASIRITSDYAHPDAEATRAAINAMVN
jgi:integrase